ncbi:MAG: ferredoxin [Verrucomicrobia bacterium]|jgi:ferredoxin|nr:ferredoxin [Verrucomicrobiota bacterium]
MAQSIHRYPQNAPGPFFVSDECIDCDQCRHHAPAFFSRDDRAAHSFVARQPVTPDEMRQCDEALDDCPVGAIGREDDR